MIKQLWSKIKALFEKDLSKIIAPIDKMHDELSMYVTKAEAKIAAEHDNIKKAETRIETLLSKKLSASTIHMNLTNLLAKL